MPRDDGNTDRSLMRDLLEDPYSFGFFQATLLLERVLGADSRPGELGSFLKEAVRFRPSELLSFPASDVLGVEQIASPEDMERFLITVSFMGVYGVNAPTPQYISEMICRSDQEHDPLRDFLDLFNHRIISLYYRAWKKYRPWVLPGTGAKDTLAEKMLFLAGFGDREAGNLSLDRGTMLLRLVGGFSQRPHNAAGLAGVVSEYFEGLPVRIEQFMPRWVKVSEEHRNRLGRARSGSVLGKDVTLGEHVMDRGGKFRIVIGPVEYERFSVLLPGGRDHADLVRLVELYAPDALSFDYLVILDSDDIPLFKLSTEGGRRLGWDTWLTTQPHQRDAAVLCEGRR